MSQTETQGGVAGYVEAISKEGELDSPAGHVWVKIAGGNENYLLPVAQTMGLKLGVWIRSKIRTTRSGPLLVDLESFPDQPRLETVPQPEKKSLSPTSKPQTNTGQPRLTVANPASIMSPTFNIRTNIGGPDDADLAYSISQHGIVQPLVVRKKEDGSLERIIGGRRQRGAKDANLTSIPVIVTEMSDADAFMAQLTENLHRKDLTDEEKGRAFQYALKTFPERFPNQEALAKALGRTSKGWVSHHIDVPEMVDDLRRGGIVVPGQLTERQVRELKQAPPEKRAEIVKELEEDEVTKPHEKPLSARKIEAKVKQVKYTHDVSAYLNQLKGDLTKQFREISTVIDDLESHQAKKIPEAQLDAVYENLVSQLKATIKRLPQKYRKQLQ